MQQTHTRIWWMEVLRGIVALSIGILFITIHVRFFISALGIYLIFDGALDIYKVARGKRVAKHKVLSYLGSALTIVLGLLCFVSYIATLLIILLIIVVRIIIRCVRTLIEARRSKSHYAGLVWLYGALLALYLLVLILFPEQTIRFKLLFLYYFISIYAICDGFYLIGKGLLLYFAPAVFTRLPAHGLENRPGRLDNLLPTTRRAVVFVRRLGAEGLGHIGWAFEWNNGWFNTGAVENEQGKPFARPEEMGFWTAHSLDPIATMQKQYSSYDEYKLFYIAQPRPKDAWKTAIWESRQPYSVLRHNCNDVAYDILRAYGVHALLDPAQVHVPNDWYDDLPGPSYTIAEHPVIPVHLKKISRRELTIGEILLTIPLRIPGTPPPWKQHGWRALYELTATWDKMLKDMQLLFILTEHHLIKRQIA